MLARAWRWMLVMVLLSYSGCNCDDDTPKTPGTPNVVTAEPDSATLEEGATATSLDSGETSLLANDSDTQARLLAVDETPVAAPEHGAVTLTVAGSFSYSHDGSETSEDSFDYRVCDDSSTPVCATATVTLTITLVNDAPTPGADAATVDEGGSVTALDGGALSLLDNDTDAEGNSLTISTTPAAQPAHGTVTLSADGTFSYTHDGGEQDTDTFSYEVCDDGTPSQCASGSVSISVLPINDPPVAADDTVTVDEGGTAALLDTGESSLTANDIDPDSSLTVSTTPTQAPVNGALTLNAGGTFTYTHDGSETMGDSFTYEACDDAMPPACDTATVAITITPVNDAPTAASDSLTVAQGSAGSVLDSGAVSLVANDTDAEGSGLIVTTAPAVAPANGTLTLGSDGTFTYTHGGGATSSDSFAYQVCDDGSPSACATATVMVAVVATNDTPVATAESLTVDEGSTTSVLDGGATSVLDNDIDPSGDALTVSDTPGLAPAHGTVTLNSDGTFAYAHDGSETASDSFQYVVCDDGTPSLCATAVVSITVNLVNDPPTVAGESLLLDEGSAVSATASGANSLLLNDSDAEGDTLSVTTAPVTPPANGTVSLTTDGTFTYTHDGSETLSDSFIYEVCDDGIPSACATASVEVEVTPVNDAPDAVTDSLTVDEGATAAVLDSGQASLLFNDSDAENNNLTVTLTPATAPANGSVTLHAGGTFSYTHDGSETGSDSFAYEVCDDGLPQACATAQVDVTVNMLNEPPVPGPDSATVAEGGTVTELDSLATRLTDNDVDPEGDTMVVTTTPITAPSNGTVALNADGTFAYTHDGSETPSDSFAYEVCDNGTPVECAVGTVTLTVTPEDDPPTATDDAFDGGLGNTDGVASATPPTTPYVDLVGPASLLANDDDPDGPALQVVAGVVATANGGTAALNADGTFVYTPPVGFVGTDSFDYTLVGAGAPSATVQIVVTGMVWYIDNASGPGDGRSSSPFGSTTAYNSAATAGLSFSPQAGDTVFVYTGVAPYDDGILLLQGQQLIGQGVDLDIGGTILVPALVDPPILQPVAGDGIALDQDNSVRGLEVDALAGNGIFGVDVGDLVIANVGSVAADAGAALDLTGGSAVSVSVGSVSVNNPTGQGVHLENLGGTVSMADLAAVTNSGAALYLHNAGTVEIAGSSSVVASTGSPVLDVADTTTVNGWVFANVTATGSAPFALRLNDLDGDLTIEGGSIATTSGATGEGFAVTAGRGDVTVRASISVTSGRSVQVTSRTTGTLTFAGNISDTGSGILLTSNSGAAITFTGQLTLSTAGNDAFAAVGGGTINATGTGSSATTSTGTPVQVLDTTLGASGVTFEAVTTAGGVNGIHLRNTGTLCGGSSGLWCFRVTGDGITRGSGGTLQGTLGDGVLLQNTRSVSLRFMNIDNTSGNGIAVPGGSTLADFELVSSDVINTGDSTLEHGINFGMGASQLTGTALIDDVLLSGMSHHGIYLDLWAGTLSLTVSNSTFERPQTSGSGILVRAESLVAPADVTVVVQDSIFRTFTNASDGVNLAVTAGASGDFTVQRNTFINPTGTPGGDNAVRISSGLGAGALFMVRDNAVTAFAGHSLSVEVGSGTTLGLVASNTVAGWNSFLSSGIYLLVDADDPSGTITAGVDVMDNIVSRTDGTGVTVINRDAGAGTATLRTRITGNTVSSVVQPFAWGIEVRGDDGNLTCATVSGNTVTGGGGPPLGEDFRVAELATSTFQLEGFTGNPLVPAEVAAYVDAQNDPPSTDTVDVVGTIEGFTPGVCGP